MPLLRLVTQINSLRDVMNPSFPPHIFTYLSKGTHLPIEWSSPKILNFAGFHPITVYSQGGQVVGYVTLTSDGQNVAAYGWGSPYGQSEVHKQIQGLTTFISTRDPAPIGTPVTLIKHQSYGAGANVTGVDYYQFK